MSDKPVPTLAQMQEMLRKLKENQLSEEELFNRLRACSHALIGPWREPDESKK